MNNLSVLTEAERHQLLVEWNNTLVDYPRDKCIHQLFEVQVELTPDAIAVVFENKQLTYSQLNARANQLARYLQKLGVKPDVLVGICVDRSLEMIVGFLGILKAGGAYVPLDPTYPEERLTFMLSDSQVQVLLTQQKFVEGFTGSGVKRVCLDTDWKSINRQSQENSTSDVTAENLAYVIYTSGSTGTPKGVAVPHRAVNRLVCNTNYVQFTASDAKGVQLRIAQASNASFDAATFEIWGSLLHGARLVVIPQNVVLSPQHFAAYIREQGISVLLLTTALFNQLASIVPQAFKDLHHLIIGGEALDPKFVKTVLRNGSPQRLVNAYGPTESTTIACWYLVQDIPEGAINVPIGRPISNTQIYILDSELQPVPIGNPGELYIGGDGLARGYLNRPDLTEEKFISNPFDEVEGSRFYKTGDLARFLPDGNIEFLGRVDNQVKIRGFRIELGEIEALLNQHPDVQQAVAIAREDIPGDKRLVAYIVPNHKLDVSATTLRRFLQEKLPNYMVPAVFVILDSLPLTPNGKVDRQNLPACDRSRPEIEATFVAPGNSIEEKLAVIWTELLGLEQIGINDNFFHLGGHSLIVTQMLSRVGEVFRVELSFDQIFAYPTIESLAQLIAEDDKEQQWQRPAIERITHEGLLPVSFAQERVYFIQQLASESSAYQFQATLRFRGQLNVAVLQQCLNEIVLRHEIFRTTFPAVDGRLFQLIHPAQLIRLRVVDLQTFPESEREAEANRLVEAEVQKPFDLNQLPLVRWVLLKLSDQEHLLIQIEHHVVHDGWSFNVFLGELVELYKAFCLGNPSPLPELPLQFVDFAHWQQQWIKTQEAQAQMAYWQQQLSGSSPLLELPYDRPRPAEQTYQGAQIRVELPISLCESLRVLSRQEGVTLFMTTLATFLVMLHRYTGGQDDLCVGTGVANRRMRETERLIGMIVNNVVLRTDLSGNPTFRELLNRVRSCTLEAFANEDLPFDKVVELLNPIRNLSYHPLYQVMFSFHDSAMPDLSLPGLNISPHIGLSNKSSKLDLGFLLIPHSKQYVGHSSETGEKGITFICEYNTDLFDAATIEQMIEQYQILLEGIVTNPIQQVSELELSLIAEQERQQLLIEWNNTTKEYPQDKCIHHLFEEQVRRSPDAIAVILEGEQLTYRELNEQADIIARHLRARGVGPDVLVGICIERSPLMVVGLLGILKAGGAYVPLDPAYPAERLAYMLSDSQVSVLLTQEKFASSLPVDAAQVIYLDTDWQNIGEHREENPLTQVKASNLAYVIYTSGSTGKPKGVMIEHRSIVNFTSSVITIYNITQSDRVLQFASIAFDWAAIEIFPCLSAGGTLVLRTDDMLMSGSTFVQRCREWEVTIIDWPTSHWHRVMVELAAAEQTLPESLRVVSVGGDAVLPASLKLWQRCVKGLANPPQLLNGYGPTEATVVATYYEVSEFITKNPAASCVPIGTPIGNLTTYILNHYLQPVPIGVPGELHIGGEGLARGYLGRPDLTAEKFIPNPFSNEPSARLYKTGDKVRYRPDGNIEFLGRIDNQVKIRGFRIEPGEIEAALSQHPNVQEAAVIAREDSPGDKRLVAYFVSNLKQPTIDELRHFLKEKLPYYMVPTAFVTLDALPLTPNGKVDRKALPTPDTARQELQADKVEPRTRKEEILAQIWREVFHREFLSIHDNFFEVGGDSILSIQIISKANSAGLFLTLKQIFQHQTIAELAAVATTTKTLKAFQGLVTGSLPLTPIQHWFFAQNLPNPHHFNQAFLLEVPATFNPDLLQQALQQLLLHHDALRLRFNQSEACWQPFNALPDETVPFSLIDLSTLQEEAHSQEIESTSSQLQASLNLNSSPLLRVALFHLGTQKPSRLLLVIHHLVVDGVSWRILLEDLQTAYQQLESGKPIQLHPKTTSFKHWAEKLTEYAFSPAAKKELTYWSNISTPKITHLPVDCNQGANTEASARSVKVSLNEEETRALLQEIHKAYHTQINDILLTALVQVLATWSGSNSVIIDLEGHGREEILPDVDLSRTVGWFTTIFPVHLELKATENLSDAIQSIKEQLRAIPNRGIGYGVLRYLSEDAEITSQLSSIPQAEVSFNYLGQFDWGMQENSFIKLASESVGPKHSQLGQRSHLLEINGLVVENQLQLEWTYSENFHQRATIESLAQDFAASLRTLIAHCLSADAGDYTPDVFENPTLHSDAQPINNDQHQENNIPLPLHLLELSPGISELLPLDTESAYPLAKMQEFMWHHYVNDSQKMGVYHCQQSHDIYDESLDLNAFKKALLILVQKHPALRTVFITSNGLPAVQVVKKNLRCSINEQDISHLKSEEQSNYIDAVMKQDRQNLFDVENPNEPLFRFRIFQKAENKFEFLISIHHAITDGWGNVEFHNELYEIYSALKKGEEITVVPTANVYKEFVALEKEIIGSQDASNFWKLHLKDHTYKPLKPLTTSVEQVEAVAEKYSFESENIADSRELCRKLKVSPKALFLSTYLDLIGTMMKSNKVCVGIISNGRTERLSDPFGALGLFWNIVPFCQPIREDKGVQIKNVQQSLIDIEPYVRYPLLEISSDQQKTELFFATFNFVNFHNAKNLKADTGLNVNWIKSHDKFNFPLNYAVSMSPVEGNVSLSVEYDRMYFSRQEIRSMIHNYIEILKHTVHTSELY
ncbi:amino acid adenylation domain-containing protein [Microcoleus sp. N9_A1]|uniref:amino acid adenylation domain-containing protein n=1 Tax=Microcoleus sp. N9_A1 TaxID=3055380 RepID=UPI002FD18BB4